MSTYYFLVNKTKTYIRQGNFAGFQFNHSRKKVTLDFCSPGFAYVFKSKKEVRNAYKLLVSLYLKIAPKYSIYMDLLVCEIKDVYIKKKNTNQRIKYCLTYKRFLKDYNYIVSSMRQCKKRKKSFI